MGWGCLLLCNSSNGSARRREARARIITLRNAMVRDENGSHSQARADESALAGRVSRLRQLRPAEAKTRKRRGSLPEIKQPSKPQQSITVRLGVIRPLSAPV
jgi:hypothetical protein